MWLLPGLALASQVETRSLKGILPLAGVLVWSLSAFLHPGRQFLHDRLAGTRIVSVLEEKTSP
jgi:uncharacterized RDD family membrane protein YckC